MQSGASRLRQWLKSLVQGQAPGQREVATTYVPLQQNIDGDWEDIGTFVFGLYQLAKEPAGLRAQKFKDTFVGFKQNRQREGEVYRFTRDALDPHDPDFQRCVPYFFSMRGKGFAHYSEVLKKALFHEDGRPKTPFEMSIISSNLQESIKYFTKKEYKWQQNNGAIPEEIYKARADEWLVHLDKAGLRIKPGHSPKTLKWYLDNPRPTHKENGIHFLMNMMALGLTLSGAVMTLMAATNPMLGLALGLSSYLVLRSANAFGTFDIGEWLMKDGFWATTKNFLTTRRLSLKNSLRTGLFIGGMLLIAALGAQAVFASALAFPFMSGISPLLANVIAGGAALWSFAATMIGLSVPVRYLEPNTGFHNNAIQPNDMGVNLPIIEQGTEIALKHRLHALLSADHHEQPRLPAQRDLGAAVFAGDRQGIDPAVLPPIDGQQPGGARRRLNLS